jgi:hypothetical protein
MLSSSRLLFCVKSNMRIKISTLQDFDDSDPTEKVTLEAVNPPEASQQTILDEPSILTGRSFIIGMILFTTATMMFVLMGGLRWLRRVIATRSHGRYYRKAHDEDPEVSMARVVSVNPSDI